MTNVSSERLADVFVEFADTLIDDYDVIEFLLMVTNRTAELVGASDVGLLLADHRGRLQFMAASNEDVKRLELFQVQVNEGPCLDAFQSGQPVVNTDLQDATGRWPTFAPRAAAAGYRSAHAFPLRLRQDVIGAIGDVRFRRPAAGARGGPRRPGPRARGDHRAAPGTGHPPWARSSPSSFSQH